MRIGTLLLESTAGTADALELPITLWGTGGGDRLPIDVKVKVDLLEEPPDGAGADPDAHSAQLTADLLAGPAGPLDALMGSPATSSFISFSISAITSGVFFPRPCVHRRGAGYPRSTDRGGNSWCGTGSRAACGTPSCRQGTQSLLQLVDSGDPLLPQQGHEAVRMELDWSHSVRPPVLCLNSKHIWSLVLAEA